jgi:hypothetical protein
MNKIFFTFFTILILNGCAATSDIGVKPKRISSSINASQFNEFASQYLERPTSVSYAEYQTIPNRLYIKFDGYGDGNSSSHFFMQDRADKYISLIDKYIEWEAQATSRGDILEKKEIGRVDAVAGVNIRFLFYSGNASSHFLIIDSGLLGSYDFAMVFNKSNVLELRKLFEDFKAGKITIANEAIYN